MAKDFPQAWTVISLPKDFNVSLGSFSCWKNQLCLSFWPERKPVKIWGTTREPLRLETWDDAGSLVLRKEAPCYPQNLKTWMKHAVYPCGQTEYLLETFSVQDSNKMRLSNLKTQDWSVVVAILWRGCLAVSGLLHKVGGIMQEASNSSALLEVNSWVVKTWTQFDFPTGQLSQTDIQTASQIITQTKIKIMDLSVHFLWWKCIVCASEPVPQWS